MGSERASMWRVEDTAPHSLHTQKSPGLGLKGGKGRAPPASAKPSLGLQSFRSHPTPLAPRVGLGVGLGGVVTALGKTNTDKAGAPAASPPPEEPDAAAGGPRPPRDRRWEDRGPHAPREGVGTRNLPGDSANSPAGTQKGWTGRQGLSRCCIPWGGGGLY